MSTATLVIGTAGHIDHGKTSLVRGLTGVDLDRLPEEKARGITIALGFTHLRLPSGRQVAFVDVPGHERLVRTMIAGASGLDAALVAVSAVEGVMPQTREHLAILDLLGVRTGVVALTMADQVDEELLELARMDVEEALAGTSLEGAPILATAVPPDGPARGLDAVIAALDALPDADRSATGPFRLPVDRAFVLRGFGTVVTGTVRSGTLQDGEEVAILPTELKARVRGLQIHGDKVQSTGPGRRTAVNLAGIERDDLARGHVLCRPGELGLSSVLDCRVRSLHDAPPIEDGEELRLLLGTADVMARAAPLDADAVGPGESRLLQLRTESPVVAMPGDRFILRRPSPAATLGGGVVLDPWASRARKRDRARVTAELQALEAGDRLIFLERAGDAGLSPAEASQRGVSGGLPLGDRILHPTRASALRQGLLDALLSWHQANPLAPGASRRELRRGALGHLSDRVFDALVAELAQSGALLLEGPRMRAAGFEVRLSGGQQQAQQAMVARVAEAGLEGVRLSELVGSDPEATALLHLLFDAGAVERVSDSVLHRDALEGLADTVRAWLGEHERMSPTDFKALTGLSRKHAIPLLEWLDNRRITARDGDARRLR